MRRYVAGSMLSSAARPWSMFHWRVAAMARFIPSTRPSQRWWKAGSSASATTGPKFCSPPMSCGPFMSCAVGSFFDPGLHHACADHRVARDDGSELLLAPSFGSTRALGNDEIAHLRGRIPDAHLDVGGQRHAEILQHAARIDDGARRSEERRVGKECSSREKRAD